MTDQSKKTSGLPLTHSANSTDTVILVAVSADSNATLRISVSDLFGNTGNVQTLMLSASSTIPANSTANGIMNTVIRSSNAIYVCVANNSWLKVPLQTF